MWKGLEVEGRNKEENQHCSKVMKEAIHRELRENRSDRHGDITPTERQMQESPKQG